MDNIQRVYSGWNMNYSLWLLLTFTMAWYGDASRKISSLFTEMQLMDFTEIIISKYCTAIVTGLSLVGLGLAIYLKFCRQSALKRLCEDVMESDCNYLDKNYPHELRQQLYVNACKLCDKMFDIPLKGIEDTLMKKCEKSENGCRRNTYRYFTDRVNDWKIFDYYRKEFKLTPELVQSFLSHIGMNQINENNKLDEDNYNNQNERINKKIDLLINWTSPPPKEEVKEEEKRPISKRSRRLEDKLTKGDLDVPEPARSKNAKAKKVPIGHRLRDIKPIMKRPRYRRELGRVIDDNRSYIGRNFLGATKPIDPENLKYQIHHVKTTMRRLEDKYEKIKEKKSRATLQRKRVKSETASNNLLLILRGLLVQESKIRSQFEKSRQYLNSLRDKFKRYLRLKKLKAMQAKAKDTARKSARNTNLQLKHSEQIDSVNIGSKSARRNEALANSKTGQLSRRESATAIASKTPRKLSLSDTKIKMDADNIGAKKDNSAIDIRRKINTDRSARKKVDELTIEAKKSTSKIQLKEQIQEKCTLGQGKSLKVKKSVSTTQLKLEQSKSARKIENNECKLKQAAKLDSAKKDLLKTPRKPNNSPVDNWNNIKDSKCSLKRSEEVLKALQNENLLDSKRPSKTPRKVSPKKSPIENQQIKPRDFSDDQSIDSVDSGPKIKKKVLKKKNSTSKIKPLPNMSSGLFNKDDDVHRESDDTVYRKQEFINNFVAQSRKWNQDQLISNAEDLTAKKRDLISTMVKFFQNQRFDKYNPYQEEMESKKRDFLIRSLDQYQQKKSLQDFVHKTIEEELREKEEYESRVMDEIMEAAYAEFRQSQKVEPSQGPSPAAFQKLTYSEGLEYEKDIAQKRELERIEIERARERERQSYEQTMYGSKFHDVREYHSPYMNQGEFYKKNCLDKELEFHQKEMERIKQKQQVSTGRNDSSPYDLEMNSNYQALNQERAIRGPTREELLMQVNSSSDTIQQQQLKLEQQQKQLKQQQKQLEQQRLEQQQLEQQQQLLEQQQQFEHQQQLEQQQFEEQQLLEYQQQQEEQLQLEQQMLDNGEMDMQQREAAFMRDYAIVPVCDNPDGDNEDEIPEINEEECQQQEEEDDSDKEREERRRMEEERDKQFEELRKTLLANDRSCRRQMEIQLAPPDSVNAPIFAAKNPIPISPAAFEPIDFGTEDFIKRITEESTPFQPYQPREDGQPNDAAPEVGRVMTRDSHIDQAYAHIRVTDMLNLPSDPNDKNQEPPPPPASPVPTSLAAIKAMNDRKAILKKLSGDVAPEPCTTLSVPDGQNAPKNESKALALYQPPGALEPIPLDLQARRVKLAASKCGETVAFKDVLTDTTYISSSKAVQLPNEFISTGARAKAVLLQLGMDTEIVDSAERHGKAVNLWSELSQKRIANSQADPFDEDELRPPTYITVPHIHMDKPKKSKDDKKPPPPPPPPPPPFISPFAGGVNNSPFVSFSFGPPPPLPAIMSQSTPSTPKAPPTTSSTDP